MDALPGEKVGLGTVLAVKKYRGWIGAKPDELVRAVAAWKPYTEALLAPVFGHLTESVLKENAKCCLAAVAPEKIAERWDAVQALLAALPIAEDVAALLARVGGKTALADLGIDETLREKLLTWSPTVRNRLTFMRLLQTLNL